MITHEALQKLIDLAQQATQIKVVRADPDTRRLHVDCGGKPATIELGSPPRRFTLHDLGALITLANTYAGNGASAIFVDRKQVEFLFSASDGRERATLPLTPSAAYTVLADLDKRHGGVAFEHKEFLQFLRFDLDTQDATILAPFRRLQWSTTDSGLSQKGHGQESLGRDIEAQIIQADQIPEQLSLPVALYSTAGEQTRYSIRCLIDLDAPNRRIRFAPASGELEHAIRLHLVDMEDRIRSGLEVDGDDPPIFRGTCQSWGTCQKS